MYNTSCFRSLYDILERLQAQLGDQKGNSQDTPCVSNTLDPLSQKLENENVELEFQVRNYEKEIAHLKTTYKNLFDSISVTRAQTKTIIDSLQHKLHDTIYENAKLRAQLFDKVSEQVDTTKGTSTNTKFANQSTERKPSLQPVRKNFVVRQPNAFQSDHTTSSKNRVPQKVDETNDLSKPVTSNSVPTPQESKIVKHDNVIAPGMFRINPFKPSREEKYVPNKVRASVRTTPITVSQPHVVTKKDVNSDSNGLSSTGVDNTAKTRRPQPRSNTKNDRVPSASKSSCNKNKEVEVEEHHRNLLLSKNKKHMSSECKHVKLDTRNDQSEVICAMSKAVLMANLSSYGSDVLSEVPISDNTNNDMLNQSVQEMPYSEPSHFVEHSENEIHSDSNIISYSQYMIESQNAVVNNDNLIANETLSAELERYKERVKLLEERQNVDFGKGKEAKNIDTEIALEKKVKELDNIVCKMGQSAQTVHMLTKPQVFYDNNLKQALGFQNPFYLKKAQQIGLMMYDSNVIAKETNNTSMNVNSSVAMIESMNYVEIFSELEQHCISLEIAIQIHKEIFQKNNTSVNQTEPSFDQLFELNNLIAELQCKRTDNQELMKAQIKRCNENSTSKSVNVDLAPKVKNNKEAYEYYLKHTMEQVAILRELVEQAKSRNPLDSATYLACIYVKQIQELLGYVRDICPDIHKPSEKLVAVTPINKKNTVQFANIAASSSIMPKVTNRYLLSSTRVKPSTSASGSKPSGNTKNDMISRTPCSNEKNKHLVKGAQALCFVFNECLFDANHAMITATNKVPLRVPIPLEVVAPEHVVTRVYTMRPKVPKSVPNSKPKVAKSMTANIMKPGTSRGSDTSVAPSSSSLIDYRLSKLLCGSRGTNLYSLSIRDIMASSPICLLSKATKTKSWLWHRRSVSIFGTLGSLITWLEEQSTLCYLNNDSENLGKLQAKADISIFIGYAPKKKACSIRTSTEKIIETIHVDFDELTAMAFEHSSLEPTLHKMTPVTLNSGLVPNLPPSAPFVPPSRHEWDLVL
ncbi:hypothetical protein Tco_0318332 [Tanacetum coccineum]